MHELLVILTNYKDVLASVATVCTILQFLTGVLVCRIFVQVGTVGDASPFPFVSGFLSCSLWLRYGIFLGDSSIVFVNIVGAILQLAYVVVFTHYTTRKSMVVRQFLMVSVALLFVMSYIQYEIDPVTAKLRLGLICCLVTIIFFAAPFANLAHVCRVKNTESLPFSMITANFLVAALWFLYGAILWDPFIMGTNGLGCMLAALQLVLFVIYPNGPVSKKGSVLL